MTTKTIIDKLGLCMFAVAFLVIQLILCFLFLAGYVKIHKMRERERKFKRLFDAELDKEDDESLITVTENKS